MTYISINENNIRTSLIKNQEAPILNWLLLPGGPGADSQYFESLVNAIEIEGNIWFVDFPNNGSNLHTEDYNYDQWLDIFIPFVKNFQNPIIVGHSFGGMLPLLFPELENLLKGLVILNSAPSLWLEEAVKYAKQFKLPDLSNEAQAFIKTPNQETFEAYLNVCIPYYFPLNSLENDKQLLAGLPFNYHAALWWQRKAIEMNFSAKWIPQKTPTIIINAEYDCIVPYTLYQNDTRFNRSNIEKIVLKGAGHFPWIENPSEIKAIFNQFEQSIKKLR